MMSHLYKSILLVLFLAFSAVSFSQKDSTHFVTTWKTDNIGNTNDSTIMINYHLGYTYNYDVDWDNDGVFDTLGLTGNFWHTYASPGTYTIRLRGQYPKISFLNVSEKLLSIDQWGTNAWADVSSMFIFCSNVVSNAQDAPDLSNVTSLYQMFAGAISFNGNLNNWNVSTITNMEKMFISAPSFNSNLDNWDVSSVTDMGFMFAGATSFNGNVSSWNVSSVQNTRAMFNGASAFNGDLSAWDVSSDTSMAFMFNQLYTFNADLSNWDVSSVKNMLAMFQGCYAFNADLSNWDVSSVKDMGSMFSRNFQFNYDLSSWKVDSVQNMRRMFYRTNSFDQNLADWNISSVTDMTQMFDYTATSVSNYDSILIAWNTKPHQLNVPLGAEGLEFCNGATARYNLYLDGWTFTGDSSICIPVGQEEIKRLEEMEITVYPNPSNGILHLNLRETDISTPILIYNSNSVLIKKVIPSSKNQMIDLSDLNNGLYIVRYHGQMKKVIIHN